jgi:hypothetical protein
MYACVYACMITGMYSCVHVWTTRIIPMHVMYSCVHSWKTRNENNPICASCIHVHAYEKKEWKQSICESCIHAYMCAHVVYSYAHVWKAHTHGFMGSKKASTTLAAHVVYSCAHVWKQYVRVMHSCVHVWKTHNVWNSASPAGLWWLGLALQAGEGSACSTKNACEKQGAHVVYSCVECVVHE